MHRRAKTHAAEQAVACMRPFPLVETTAFALPLPLARCSRCGKISHATRDNPARQGIPRGRHWRIGRGRLFPLRLGAAVLFSDGSVKAASQRKALEYGCTLDAVCADASSVPRVAPQAQRCFGCRTARLAQARTCALAYTSTTLQPLAPTLTHTHRRTHASIAMRGYKVTKLSAFIEERRPAAAPLLIVQSDQFGILHPPCARARSYLWSVCAAGIAE
jgi:hypothetical protein